MITIVDRNEKGVVQKVTSPKGMIICYQAGMPGDSATMQRFERLHEAREYIGKGNNGKEAKGS